MNVVSIEVIEILMLCCQVLCVLGFCKSAMDWDLGVGEAIAGVIVIGYSVDYVVHLAHMYCEGKHFGHQTRHFTEETCDYCDSFPSVSPIIYIYKSYIHDVIKAHVFDILSSETEATPVPSLPFATWARRSSQARAKLQMTGDGVQVQSPPAWLERRCSSVGSTSSLRWRS